MVVKQMSDDNQLLMYFKNKVVKEQMSKKSLEQYVEILSEKLRNTTVENQVIKLRTQSHHEQNKEEVCSMFYKCTTKAEILNSLVVSGGNFNLSR